VVAARCDYADQFRFKSADTDVPVALRDFVLVPDRDGGDASLVIVDRSSTSARDRGMYVRFRVPAQLALAGAVGSGIIGKTRLAIAGMSHATPVTTRVGSGDCYKGGVDQGKCEAARFPVTDYRLVVAGPEPRAVHVISTTATNTQVKTTKLDGESCSGVRISGSRDAVVVWPEAPRGFSYRVPRGRAVTHVILESASVVTRPDGNDCVVTASAGGTAPPSIVTLDESCQASSDPERGVLVGPAPKAPMRARSGCCSSGTTSVFSIISGLAVLGFLVLKRHRRGRNNA
jgi:hypothetical protein